MEQNSASTNTTKKRNLFRDIVTAMIVIAASAAAMIIPFFYFITAVLCCALVCGGRKHFALLLAAASFAVQVFLSNGFFLALLFLTSCCIMIAPVRIFRKHFSSRAHFNGVLGACAGIALMIAVLYTLLYLVLGGDPIHILSEASHASFVSDTSPLGTEMLRTMWQTRQVFSLVQNDSQIDFSAVMQIAEKSIALSHSELAAQTHGFIEMLTRTTLPSVCVIAVSLGGLLMYVLPTHWMAHRDRGIGRHLALTESARPLPAFSDWHLPRDIGACLFIALILLLIISFTGVTALDGAMTLIYTLFNTVFYVQGISLVAFMTRRWKWKKVGRIALCTLAAVLVSPISMLGTIDYIIRLREFLDFSKKLKDAAQSGNTENIKHIFPGITIHSVFEVQDRKKDADTSDQNNNEVDHGAENAHDDKEE